MILSNANSLGLNVAFVGSTINVLNKIRIKISKEFPALKICCTISPDYIFESDPEKNIKLVNEVQNAKPDILFLALGSPRQEIWLSKYKDQIGAKINIGVGAVFDFYSGTKTRSPAFLQKFGLEWLWRLFYEPGRLFKRYIISDIPFFIKQSFRIKFLR